MKETVLLHLMLSWRGHIKFYLYFLPSLLTTSSVMWIFYVVYTMHWAKNIKIKTNYMHCFSQRMFYMFRAMQFHHQEVSCRIQALWYSVNVQVYMVLWQIITVHYM